MGISETILAAMIGAIATVTTALFQLFTALRNRAKVDARPKRGMTARSILAIFALMVASAAGGFLYSEFIKQRAGEDMRAMRTELKELKELTARFAAQKLEAVEASQAATLQAATFTASAPEADGDAAAPVESVVYVPACRGNAGAPCTEGEAQRVALCGAIPAFARVVRIDLFAQPDAVQNAWEQHRAALEQDIGGARFTGKSFEYAQGEAQKAVCVNFLHWSSDHPHIARIVVQYGFDDAPAQASPTPSEPPAPAAAPATSAVVAADNLAPIPQAAAFNDASAR